MVLEVMKRVSSTATPRTESMLSEGILLPFTARHIENISYQSETRQTASQDGCHGRPIWQEGHAVRSLQLQAGISDVSTSPKGILLSERPRERIKESL